MKMLMVSIFSVVVTTSAVPSTLSSPVRGSGPDGVDGTWDLEKVFALEMLMMSAFSVDVTTSAVPSTPPSPARGSGPDGFDGNVGFGEGLDWG